MLQKKIELKIIYLIKLKKINWIGSIIENFIEQANQFGVLDEKRTDKLIDRSKAVQSHSTNEWIGLNGCIRKRIIEVNDNSKRKNEWNKHILNKKKYKKSWKNK